MVLLRLGSCIRGWFYAGDHESPCFSAYIGDFMWDSHSAVTYIHQHASNHSQGKCAHAVTVAIRKGGANIPLTPSAKDMGATLTRAGFYRVEGEPVIGDVVVIRPISHHPDGHVSLYDGKKWISDFVQNSLYPGNSYKQAHPTYKVYRHS